jgi:hypothetical protein
MFGHSIDLPDSRNVRSDVQENPQSSVSSQKKYCTNCNKFGHVGKDCYLAAGSAHGLKERSHPAVDNVKTDVAGPTAAHVELAAMVKTVLQQELLSVSKEIRHNNASSEQRRCNNCNKVGHLKNQCRLPGGGLHEQGKVRAATAQLGAQVDLTAAVKAAIEQELAPIKKRLAEMEGEPSRRGCAGP